MPWPGLGGGTGGGEEGLLCCFRQGLLIQQVML